MFKKPENNYMRSIKKLKTIEEEMSEGHSKYMQDGTYKVNEWMNKYPRIRNPTFYN